MERLRQHNVTLQRGHVVLRPMTEGDWGMLLRWNSDPDVLYFSEEDDVTSYSLGDVQEMYRSVSRSAFCFIIEFDGLPIGECWLQAMNLARILTQHPDRDCRRIDPMIGEKAFWGQGIGSEVIRLLTEFGFEKEGADKIFACEIADYNVRSLKAFQKVGFEIDAVLEQPSGRKAHLCYDLVLTKEKYFGHHPSCDLRKSASTSSGESQAGTRCAACEVPPGNGTGAAPST